MLRSAQQQVQQEFKQVVRERRRAYVQNRFDCVVRHLGLKACMWYYCKCAQLLDCYSTLIVYKASCTRALMNLGRPVLGSWLLQFSLEVLHMF